MLVLPRLLDKRNRVSREEVIIKPIDPQQLSGHKRNLERAAEQASNAHKRKRLKQTRKRANNPKVIDVHVPITPLEVKQAKEAASRFDWTTISHPTVVKNLNSDVQIVFLKRCFTQEVLKAQTTLTEATCDVLWGKPEEPLIESRIAQEDQESTNTPLLPIEEEGQSSTNPHPRRYIPSPVLSPEPERPPPPPFSPPRNPPSPELPREDVVPPSAPRQKRTECYRRGQARVCHLGITRRNTKHCVMFAETADEAIVNYIANSTAYLEQIEATLREQGLDSLLNYMKDKTPTTNKGEICSLAKFPSGAILEGNSDNVHIDKNDFRSGYCCITTTGDYKGGEIEFPLLKLRFVVRPGDIIFFRSHILHHKSTIVTQGRRFALVLFANNNVFTARPVV